MIDKKKVYDALELSIFYGRQCLDQPNEEEDFYIPIIKELSKNVDETINFLEELNSEQFIYSLAILDELVEKTQSHKLIDAVRQIGKEKGIDEFYYESVIKRASCWFDDNDD